MKKEIQELRRHFRKQFGNPCPNFHYACAVCSGYMALDILKDLYIDENDSFFVKESQKIHHEVKHG